MVSDYSALIVQYFVAEQQMHCSAFQILFTDFILDQITSDIPFDLHVVFGNVLCYSYK